MNEEQAKKLLRKSALQTTDGFTDSLMERIEAKSADQAKNNLPSIRKIFPLLAVVVLLLSYLIFYSDFKFLSGIKILGGSYRTKMFVVFLFSVLLGLNQLLRLQPRRK